MNSPTRTLPRSTYRSLYLAMRLTLLAAPLTLPASALAEQRMQRYDIQSGPLGEVLGRYAQASGAPISFQSDQVRGLMSPGVQGSFTTDDGFAQLLLGSGPVSYTHLDVYKRQAQELGLSRRMLAYYRSGEKPVPKTVALAMKGWEALRLAEAEAEANSVSRGSSGQYANRLIGQGRARKKRA